MPTMNRKPPSDKAGSFETQSVLLPKDWDRARVVKWLEEHGYVAGGIDEPGETGEHWRARQYDPEHFRNFRNLPLTGSGGVLLVRGVVKGGQRDGVDHPGYRRICQPIRVDGNWEQIHATGMLRVEGVILRVGVNDYELPDGGVSREYKSQEDVFDPHTIASFDGVPITIGHPDGFFVGPNSYRDVVRGHISGPFREDRQAGVVYGWYNIGDGSLIDLVNKKKICEVSPGFYAEIDAAPGQTPDGQAYDAFQRFITANHMATGPEFFARGGREMRLALDGRGDVILGANKASDNHNPKEESKLTTKIIVIDGKPYQVDGATDGFEEALKAQQEASAKALADAKAETAKAQGEAAAEKARADGLQAKFAEATSSAFIAKAAQARAELMTQAKLVAGDEKFTCDGDNLTVMKTALLAGGEKLDGLEGKPDGFAEGYVTATFTRLASQKPTAEQQMIEDSWKPEKAPEQKAGQGKADPVTSPLGITLLSQFGGAS